MKAGHTCNMCFHLNSGQFSAGTCGTSPSLVLCSVTKPAAVDRLKDFSQARLDSNNNQVICFLANMCDLRGFLCLMQNTFVEPLLHRSSHVHVVLIKYEGCTSLSEVVSSLTYGWGHVCDIQACSGVCVHVCELHYYNSSLENMLLIGKKQFCEPTPLPLHCGPNGINGQCYQVRELGLRHLLF